MDASETFWRFALGTSAISLVIALVLFISPELGVSRVTSGLWILASIICFAVAKSQTKRWNEDDDLPNYPPGVD